MVKQISVFIENKSGRLAEATRVVGSAGVNIRALSVADTSDFGVLRLIADNTDKALAALKGAGFTATATDVIAVEVADKPGGLAELLDKMGGMEINVEYLYAFFKKSRENAIVIIRVEEQARALKLLSDGGFKLLSAEEVCSV